MRIWLLLLTSLLFAKEHTVMIEPLQIYHIKSAVAASVLEARDDLEGKVVHKQQIIRLDDVVDREELRSLRKKHTLLDRVIGYERARLKTLRSLLAIKRSNYERIKDLKTKSKFEKEQRKGEYLNAKSTLEAQESKIANLLMQKRDLSLAIAKLEDRIKKKNLTLTGYVYKVYPRRGDFVAVGAPLVDLADISKGKVTLYLGPEELEKRVVYIDGKRTDLRITKLIKIPDGEHLGEYRAEIIVPKPKYFGKFIKVELR